MSFFESGITGKRLQRGARKPFYRRAAHDGLGFEPAADLMPSSIANFFKDLCQLPWLLSRLLFPSIQTNLLSRSPSQKGIYTEKVPGSRITGGRPGATVRSRFRGEGGDAATCANGGRARYTLAAQGRARRGQSNALPGWVGDPLWQLQGTFAG